MTIYEYLDAIYSNTTNNTDVIGIATISSAILIGSSSKVSSATFDISSYVANYEDLTEDNFIIELNSLATNQIGNSSSGGSSVVGCTPVKTYDYKYGTLTITGLTAKYYDGSTVQGTGNCVLTAYADINVYLFGNVDITTVTSSDDISE